MFDWAGVDYITAGRLLTGLDNVDIFFVSVYVGVGKV